MNDIRSNFFAVHKSSGVSFRDNCNTVVVVTNLFSPPPSLTYFIFCFIVVGSTVYRSTLSRFYTIDFALYLHQTPYICKTTVTYPTVPSSAISSILPPSKVQGTPITLNELSSDTIDNMTVEEMRSVL